MTLGAQPGLEPATCKLQVRCPTNYTTAEYISKYISPIKF